MGLQPQTGGHAMRRDHSIVALVLAVPFDMIAAGIAFADVAAPTANPAYDEALATAAGADDYGMHNYVLVILKTGPTRVPDGPERDAMFQGHFANIKRLAGEGKLVLAGPLDGADGWRGLFVFDVAEIADARKLVATRSVCPVGRLPREEPESDPLQPNANAKAKTTTTRDSCIRAS
jgi:uncharacterized protein YciI